MKNIMTREFETYEEEKGNLYRKEEDVI